MEHKPPMERETSGTHQRFGELLKEGRIARGMTQIEFALLLGCDQPQYSRLETGQTQYPPLLTAVKIAKVLGWSIEDLYMATLSEEEHQLSGQIHDLEEKLQSVDPDLSNFIAPQLRERFMLDSSGMETYLKLLKEYEIRTIPTEK